MIKNQKFFMSLLCVIGLGFAQVAWGLGEEFQAKAPVSDVAAKMQGSADEDPNADYDLPGNIVARNDARQAAADAEQARVDKVKNTSNSLSKISHITWNRKFDRNKDSISLKELISGKPDPLSVDTAKKIAVSKIIDEQYPKPDLPKGWDDNESDQDRDSRITKQAQENKEKAAVQAKVEEKFVQDLPSSIKNLNLEQLNEKDASGNLTMSLNTLLAVAKKYDVELLDIFFAKYYRRKFSGSGLNRTFKDVGFKLLLGLPVKFTDFEQKNQLIEFNKSMQNGAKEFLINLVSQKFIQNLPSSIDAANLNFLNATDASGNLLMSASVFYNVAKKYLEHDGLLSTIHTIRDTILSKIFAEDDEGKKLNSSDLSYIEEVWRDILGPEYPGDEEHLKIINKLNNSVEFQNKLKEAFKTAIFNKQEAEKLRVEQQEAFRREEGERQAAAREEAKAKENARARARSNPSLVLDALQTLELTKIDGKMPDAATIRNAYLKLAVKHHPDKGGTKEEFQKLQNAYEFLKLLTTP